LGNRKQEVRLADKLGKDINVKAVEKKRKNTIMKIRESKIKQVNKFT
jgi:hypothetical protein